MNSSHEFTGKTVDDAIQAGLARLGLREEQAEIEVVSKGSRGIFGIGSEPALVRISPRPTPAMVPPAMVPPAVALPPAAAPVTKPVVAPPTAEAAGLAALQEGEAEAGDKAERDAATVVSVDRTAKEEDEALPSVPRATPVADEDVEALAVDLLYGLVQRMGFDAQIIASWHIGENDEGARYLQLDVHGSDLGSLIGRRGETLENMQYLLRLMVNQRLRHWNNIVIDVEHYKQRRVEQLDQLALRMADQVVQSGRSISLEPMPANERRIVHMALRDHPQVYTESTGEGERRKVHILLRSRS